MFLDFSDLFHQLSKDHSARGAARIPNDPREWPIEWKTTYYKDYPSSKKIRLTDAPPQIDLFSAISSRKSGRLYGEEPVTKDELSVLLKYACGEITYADGKVHRAQASGGGRFPIEVYPIIFRGTPDLSSGLYHYNVREHSLDVLWERTFTKEDIAELFTYPWVQDAPLALVMTAVFSRNKVKYKERGYRYLMLEAGHIGQNLYLTSAALDLECCALGGTRDESLEEFIDIDGTTESVVYGFSFGKKKAHD
ncbi:MAG: SagB/ThcOx family dehydrogenase [Candidatus Pacebacteria bacterium]|nr:SagB/ThcOx family dehydrogenase [Candidatus Paceibacterota bacterium]